MGADCGSFAFRLNYPEFPDSCLSLQFSLSKYILKVLIDRSHVLLEQASHLLLRQPNRFICEFDLKAHSPVLGLVKNGFRPRRRTLLAHGEMFY